MNKMHYKENLEALRRADFAKLGSGRLHQFRRAYTGIELDPAHVNLSRLEFVRWLVRTGRLTEQRVREKEQEHE